MSPHPHPHPRRRQPMLRRALVVAAAAVTLLATAGVAPASAHGAIIGPPSRSRYCFENWNYAGQPGMAQQDAMCYQLFQSNPSAVYGWMGVYWDGLRGNFQGRIRDGELCSGGKAQGGQFAALDTIGDWKTTPIGNTFTASILDEASHGADYIHVYATRQGFDPLTQPLTWADLEKVGEVGNTPAAQWGRGQGGVQLDFQVTAPGRTGRHILYTIWQASHNDQTYFWCSDVVFPG